jgi:NADH-quinone oxidoreductase subunit L
MPITAITCWIGSLALIGTPLFSGFYSKDLIIDAVKAQHHLHPGNGIVTYALWCVMIGVFVTAFYSFRLLFMTFHGKPRFDTSVVAHDDHGKHETHTEEGHGAHDDHSHDEHGHGHHGGPPKESPWVVTAPLIVLAIPSVIIGLLTVVPLIFGNGFGSSIFIDEAHNVIPELHEEFHDVWAFAWHALQTPVFWLVTAGVFLAWALYIKWPHLPGVIDSKLKPLRWVLERKYGFDLFNEKILAAGSRVLGRFFWKTGDQFIIDKVAVDGSAHTVGVIAGIVRRVQTGFLYSYAFWMVTGLAVMLGWFVTRA